MTSRTTRLEIAGMSCANCAATISESIEELAGIEEVSVNYATDEGSVTYDPERVTLGEVYEAIEEAGYDPARASVTIPITDMTCANCAETNEEALLSTPGVVDAEVNYATDEARVEYNPADTDVEALYDAIEDADTPRSVRAATRRADSRARSDRTWRATRRYGARSA